MDEMIAYFYSDGDLTLMLTKVMCYLLALFFLAVVIGSFRKLRL